MAMKYARIGNVPVYIMQKASKKNAPKGFVVVQSLINGDTATVSRKKLKGITTKRPSLKR